jgi:hypothetical protein
MGQVKVTVSATADQAAIIQEIEAAAQAINPNAKAAEPVRDSNGKITQVNVNLPDAASENAANKINENPGVSKASPFPLTSLEGFETLGTAGTLVPNPTVFSPSGLVVLEQTGNGAELQASDDAKTGTKALASAGTLLPRYTGDLQYETRIKATLDTAAVGSKDWTIFESSFSIKYDQSETEPEISRQYVSFQNQFSDNEGGEFGVQVVSDNNATKYEFMSFYVENYNTDASYGGSLDLRPDNISLNAYHDFKIKYSFGKIMIWIDGVLKVDKDAAVETGQDFSTLGFDSMLLGVSKGIQTSSAIASIDSKPTVVDDITLNVIKGEIL